MLSVCMLLFFFFSMDKRGVGWVDGNMIAERR